VDILSGIEFLAREAGAAGFKQVESILRLATYEIGFTQNFYGEAAEGGLGVDIIHGFLALRQFCLLGDKAWKEEVLRLMQKMAAKKGELPRGKEVPASRTRKRHMDKV